MKIKKIYVVAIGYIFADYIFETEKGYFYIANNDESGNYTTEIKKLTDLSFLDSEIDHKEKELVDIDDYILEKNKQNMFEVPKKAIEIIYFKNYLYL